MFKSLGPGALGLDVSFTEAAELAADNGFSGLQLDTSFLRDRGADRTKEIYDRFSLKPGSFGLPVDIYADDDDFQKSLFELKKTAELASDVGCSRASTYIMSFSDRLSFEENFSFHRERISQAAEILADHNISLGLEFLGPKTIREGHEYEFIYTIEGMLNLASEVKTDNMGLLLDAWHWYTSGEDIKSLKKLKRDDVIDVHVNDAPAGIARDKQQDTTRCLPGETGVIKIDVFMQHLKDIGYQGPVMVEPFSSELEDMPPGEVVGTVARALDKIWI